jgi:inorganic triphosphatase YgiF
MTGEHELEATLIILSDNSQTVAQHIAVLTSVANYRLLAQVSQPIRDLYLDTPDKALQAKRIALRIRELRGKHWITLKGPSQPTEEGGVERLEIEALWSQDSLAKVVQELLGEGIEMPRQSTDFDLLHPVSSVASLGLKIIQHRETHRQVRNIVPMSAERKPVLAELAIDSVAYHFGDQEIRHHELEIEAKVRDGSTVLRSITESLISRYGPVLRRWDHGKLATGKAIEQLLRERALEELLDRHNHLKPVAYDTLDDYLKRRSN